MSSREKAKQEILSPRARFEFHDQNLRDRKITRAFPEDEETFSKILFKNINNANFVHGENQNLVKFCTKKPRESRKIILVFEICHRNSARIWSSCGRTESNFAISETTILHIFTQKSVGVTKIQEICVPFQNQK